MEKRYTVGVDFGSLSGRAVLVDTKTGEEVATAAMDYPHGVMDRVLAKTGELLPDSYALQDPADYLSVLCHVLCEVISLSGVQKEEIAGIGIDFTCCTVLPVTKDGTPLCFLEEFAGNKHAYVKLWKHHAAGSYADRMNEVARERHEPWLARFGGAVSSEWMFPKIWQVLEQAPEVYEAAAYFVEAGDWLTWMLTGKRTRSYAYAAYKALYVKGEGYPKEDYFAALDTRLTHVVKDKLDGEMLYMGDMAGCVSETAAKRFHLATGTTVSCPLPDGHCPATALGIKEEGDLFAVLGTSACFMLVGKRDVAVPGTCGTVADGMIPSFYGYEAGLCCLGDHFAYAAEKLTSQKYREEADARGISMLRLLIEKASKKRPGESGVLALNWFNGNRSTLVNSSLSGAFVGMTLETEPEDLMRALIEATAFGARHILENFAAYGVPVRRIVATGGIARKDPFTMQLYADVLGQDIRIAKTAQAPAYAMAISAAVAAGVYADFESAMAVMSGVGDTVYHPDAAAHAVYDRLYAHYMTLHDYFGKQTPQLMASLRALRAEAKGE